MQISHSTTSQASNSYSSSCSSFNLPAEEIIAVAICKMEQLAARRDQDEPVQSEEGEFSMMQHQYSWLLVPIQCRDACADEQIQVINYSIEEQNYDKDKSVLVCCGY